jgi:hypothetical protein
VECRRNNWTGDSWVAAPKIRVHPCSSAANYEILKILVENGAGFGPPMNADTWTPDSWRRSTSVLCCMNFIFAASGLLPKSHFQKPKSSTGVFLVNTRSDDDEPP